MHLTFYFICYLFYIIYSSCKNDLLKKCQSLHIIPCLSTNHYYLEYFFNADTYPVLNLYNYHIVLGYTNCDEGCASNDYRSQDEMDCMRGSFSGFNL